MTIHVLVSYDQEAGVWIAENENIGLILESDSYDELIRKVSKAVPELLELNQIRGARNIQYDTLAYEEALA